MSNEKIPDSPIVTLVEDPFGLPTTEVYEAQDNPEELDFDLETPEDIENQFDKLAQAISDQAPAISEEAPAGVDSEAILAEQIAEDQALEREVEKQQNQEDETPVVLEHPLDAQELQSCIESILFISDKPIAAKCLHDLLGPHFTFEQFQESLTTLKERYQSIHHGIELVEVAGGYQFRTKPGRADLVKKLARVQSQRLSTGAMETLAIIA